MDPSNIDDLLIQTASQARRFAVADFSDFAVGAALLTSSGQIIHGCNIENATYGLTVCAERVALWKALSDGHREFRQIAIVTDAPTLTPPCGACRQLLWEFCGDMKILLANTTGLVQNHQLSILLPFPFDRRSLT
ncbi:cytidine deaminase [Tuwongella immobilis]|uniref:cytidine deaminase n=1 Tax=Tuwongella immobilis TaxID=692036 RepID=UPI0013A6EF9B|nr:cytidine deaminase [Tuwongella immobilis]